MREGTFISRDSTRHMREIREINSNSTTKIAVDMAMMMCILPLFNRSPLLCATNLLGYGVSMCLNDKFFITSNYISVIYCDLCHLLK